MIDKQTDPVAWSLLIDELKDAQDAINTLLRDANNESDYGEEEFRVDMAHAFMHLNRAWHCRNATLAQHDDNAIWDEWAQYPTDLNPLNSPGL
ncbi:hypothetical protein ACVWYF_001772 [Hymenobacter sp. UYAg731]